MSAINQKKFFTTTAVVMGLCLSWPGSAIADNPGGWEYSVAPLYLWAKNVSGESDLGPTSSELELDFKDDILENLDGAAAIHFVAKQGDLSLYVQYNYAQLDPSVDAFIGPVPINVSIKFKDVMWEAGVRYVVAETDSTQWEVQGGVRGLDQDIDIKFEGPEGGPGLLPDKVSGGDDWWHGFGGVRMTTKLSQSWTFVGSADMGYKSSHNKSGQLLGLFDYRFKDWGSFFMGYRYLDIDFDNKKSGADAYSFEGDNQGPILGLNFYF